MIDEKFLNPTNCSKFASACKKGRCPLTCVCTDECVFVWKAEHEDEMPKVIADLESDIDDMASELRSTEQEYEELEGELNDLKYDFYNLEEKYDQCISDLSLICNRRILERIGKALSVDTVEWFIDLEAKVVGKHVE